MNRRDFLLTTGAVAATVLSLPVLQPKVFAASAPPVPTTPVDCGPLKSFDKDGVSEKFSKKPNYFFLVRQDGKLYACSAICTHKYRALTVKNDEFYCPAHKSEFTFQGTVTGGPAQSSLPRYGIKVNDAGNVIVDCTREFSEAKWGDADSFVKV